MNNSHGGVSQSSSITTGSTLRPRGSKRPDAAQAQPAIEGAPHRAAATTTLELPVSSSRARSTSPFATASNRSDVRPRPRTTVPFASSGRPVSLGPDHRLQSKGSAPSLATLWGTSWTAIQGIASDLLNSDGSEIDEPQRRRRPKSGFLRSTSTNHIKQWGPDDRRTVAESIGQGSAREERDALVRAQKRKDLLSGVHSAAYADAAGRYKRRTSDDGGLTHEGDQGLGDALAYLHNVQQVDTLAGITIRYGCTAATLRKANRMWPNDTIQTKQTLLLPVASCSVKGTLSGPPGKAPEVIDVEADDMAQPLSTQSRGRLRTESFSNNSQRTTASGRSASEVDQSWTHDSWTLLSNSTTPTQIVRLPRRALGYFPPARRKSQTFSDLDSRNTSLDAGRTSISDDNVLLGTSPARLLAASQRPRRQSNANNGYFPSFLAGPGGVGTMDKNVKSPGPAQDGLNRLLASHLPNFAPPTNQTNLHLPDVPMSIDHSLTHGQGQGGTWSPIGSSGTQSPRLHLENVGGAIESWMRKVAIKASSVLEPGGTREPAQISAGLAGRGSGSVGDLIELAENFEIGSSGDGDEEQGRPGGEELISSRVDAGVLIGGRGRVAASATGLGSTGFGHGPSQGMRARTSSGTDSGARGLVKSGKRD